MSSALIWRPVWGLEMGEYQFLVALVHCCASAGGGWIKGGRFQPFFWFLWRKGQLTNPLAITPNKIICFGYKILFLDL